MKYIFIPMLILILFSTQFAQADDKIDISDPLLRMMRIYGNNETEPPILVLAGSGDYEANIGSESITVEMDISANVPPSLYARFVHCTADWKETPNLFYQDLGSKRFSSILWESSTFSNSYYSYRGKFQFPNANIKFKNSGNWKVMFYQYDKDETPFAIAKFFVVETRAGAELSIWNDMYDPAFSVSSTCYNMEASVWSNATILDNNQHSCVLYRNNRFEEPIVITENNDINSFEYLYRYQFKKTVEGFVNSRKFFRIEGLPAENEYRVLDLTNVGFFPRGSNPTRLPFSDYRRNGTFYDFDSEGVMLTDNVPSAYDDYVNVEFIMDPDGQIASEDVFLIGSFNDWTPTASWQMFYDSQDRYYKLRQWVRRGFHNYLYATGQYNYDLNRAVRYSTDQFEGNTSLNDHFFLAFFYYKDVALGGYDAIIAVKKQSISRKY